MALNALLPYLEGIIDGLQIPGNVGTLKAQTTPPAMQGLTDPVAYILPARMVGDRRTAPRPLASMELVWAVGHEITFLTNPNPNPNVVDIKQQWALIIDAILYAYWGTTMPTPITDPTTGRVTRVVAIGEHVELENAPLETPASQRSLLYKGLLHVDVKEWVQA